MKEIQVSNSNLILNTFILICEPTFLANVIANFCVYYVSWNNSLLVTGYISSLLWVVIRCPIQAIRSNVDINIVMIMTHVNCEQPATKRQGAARDATHSGA